MKKQTGFTLIELVVVVVILGILAAYAVPRYMNIDREARISVVKGLQGSLYAASDMVHAIAVSREVASGASVDVGSGNSVVVGAGLFPDVTATGITAALREVNGFTAAYTAGVATFTKDGAPTPANCSVVYAVTGTNSPAISRVETGC